MRDQLVEPLEGRTYCVQGFVQGDRNGGAWDSPAFVTTGTTRVNTTVARDAVVSTYVDADLASPYVLDVFGTGGNDLIAILAGQVYVNRVFRGTIEISTNGVTTLRVNGGRGDDEIFVDPPPPLPTQPTPFYGINVIEIFGGGGNDTITGSARAERVMAGDGNDIVSAGDGRDTVYGEGGDDSLRGGGSSDLLNGGDGLDTLRGDAGNDNLDGGPSKDRLRGSLGNDRLQGGGGNDIIAGEDGNDAIFGGAGADFIDGGDGDDDIAGEGAADFLHGGAGSDAFPDIDYDDHSDFGRADTDRVLGDRLLPDQFAGPNYLDWLNAAHAAAYRTYGRDYSDAFIIQKFRLS